MSISDDIAKVLEMRPLLKIGVVTRDEIEQVCTIAPRLAAWAQQVMPLVEAAERVRRLHREYTIDDAFGTAKDAHASYQAARLAEELLVEAALALNLEVPT